MIGKTLAHYEITSRLGKGGMGEVYRARDTRLNRDVALKVVPAELAADVQRRNRFEREAQMVAALNHPNVVTIHAVEEADDVLFLVMELVDGQTLDHVIPDEGLTLPGFFELALPLAEAVASAHAKGITHRDLKPGNVMIDVEGRVKVLDFGLAKLLEPAPEDDATMLDAHATREGTVMGTAAYMSPEQAEGKPVDPRSDVFSLGILFYEMLTGQRPFQGDTHMSTMSAVLKDEPRAMVEIRPDLPKHLSRILRRCLEKDPDRRYATARDLRYDLEILQEEFTSGEHEPALATPAAEPVASGSPASVPPGSVPPASAESERSPSSAPKGSHRKFLFPMAALAVLAIAAALYFQFRPGPGSEVATEEAAPPAEAVAQTPVIVVFPFENLGPPEDAYFAAGMTDEITTRLGAVTGLRVLSSSSSKQYDRSGKTMQQIADDLGIDYVLDGAVRWQKSDTGPSRVRVTPQLVRATDDHQVWAEVYDRTMEEIFVVQSEIAGEVIQSLGGTLDISGPEASGEQPTENLAAYHAYLRGRNLLESVNYRPETWTTAIELMERAVALDPAFAEAYGFMAKAHAGFCHFNWDRTEERLAKSRAAADQALALGPELARSHIGVGYYHYWGLKEYERALEAFQRAAAIQPNDAEVIESIAFIRRRQGRFEDALAEFRRVAELRPSDDDPLYDLAETLSILGSYDEAIRAAEQAIQLAPDQYGNYVVAGETALLMGRSRYATEVIESYPGAAPAELMETRFRIAYHTRDYAGALSAARELPAMERRQFRMLSRPFAEALVHRAMGRDDLADASLAEARQLIETDLENAGANSIVVSTLGIILAASGEAEAGVREARRALELFPADRDAWIRQWGLGYLAMAQSFAGQEDDAIATLRELFAKPNNALSVSMLQSSPAFDNLRASEEFSRLLEDHM